LEFLVKKKKDEEDEVNSPSVVRQGYDVHITSNKGKKITGIVRNIVCQKNGSWKFDIHRKSDEAFILNLEWKD
jgi:hypothetical protein